jgi:hypothetical protein
LMSAVATSSGAAEEQHHVALDLLASLPTRHGSWSLLLEMSANPAAGGVPALFKGEIPSHCHLSGRPGGEGIELAELHYGFAAVGGEWSVGLIDATAHIDSSAVANDEKTQFINPVFVNNPGIGLPGNALGFTYRREPASGWPGLTALVMTASAHGHEAAHEHAGPPDGAQNGYRLFTALEAHWPSGSLGARLGAWEISRGLSGWGVIGSQSSGRGIYTAVDGRIAAVDWNLRVGWSDPGTGGSRSFAGAAIQIPIGGNRLGLAAGHSRLTGSADAETRQHSWHVETYYRHQFGDRYFLAPSLQYEWSDDTDGGTGGITLCLRLSMNL